MHSAYAHWKAEDPICRFQLVYVGLVDSMCLPSLTCTKPAQSLLHVPAGTGGLWP